MIVQIAKVMNLGMTIVARRDTVIGPGRQDLVRFNLAVCTACVCKSRLEKTAAAAAAVIVRSVWGHFDEIFFTHHRLDHKAQVFRDRVTITFTYDLARILNRELDFQVPVPVGTDFQSSFPDPFCVVLIDAFYFKIVRDVELLQSGPD